MTVARHLHWAGCANVRDLGGLRTIGGRTTPWRSVIRSDGLDRLTPAGWEALEGYGVQTVIDLRNDIEREAEPYTCDVTVVPVPIEDDTDDDFIRRWRPFSTPHYYRAALERWPHRTAAALVAIARAGSGGVVIHCGLGRDRTGLVVMLALALAGVPPDEIATDYELSAGRLPPLDVDALLDRPSNVNARSRRELEDDFATERRRRQKMSDREAMLATLASLDVAAYLRAAGVDDDDLQAVRTRLEP